MDQSDPPTGPWAANPAVWPDELLEVFARSVTAEFASLTRAGKPVTMPTTPYMGGERRTLDVSTGLTYPAKAERARRDPRVCLLFADPVGSGLVDPPVVLVQGLATVRDADLQANTDRYVRVSMEKIPAATKGQPRFVLRRLAWYYARIWVEVTPVHIRWWPSRALEEPARTWEAPEATAAPLSDPAPGGAQPSAWLAPPASWRTVAEGAVGRLPMRDLTVVDDNGFPACLPVARSELLDDGFRLHLGPGAPAVTAGPACLTMHAHPEVFTGQENRTFIGTVDADGVRGAAVRFRAERALADWSLAGGRARTAIGFLTKGRRLSPRLAAEAQRRFQPVPEVRLPGRR
ncbi:MAG TPA: pyridoxamine 5'-phosphate oxidase family protein [Acidimicrobiales bacterium]|nr:pyridoxamine 5'-phosphate oxidase family protein [Acidimicrobiales bacterium]